MLDNSNKRSRRQKAKRIAKKLNDHALHKSHGRMLSRSTIKDFGLRVHDLEDDQDLQDAVLSVFHAVTHSFNGTNAAKIIENHQGNAWMKLTPVRASHFSSNSRTSPIDWGEILKRIAKQVFARPFNR